MGIEEQLTKIKKSLVKKGCPKKEVDRSIKQITRSMERTHYPESYLEFIDDVVSSKEYVKGFLSSDHYNSLVNTCQALDRLVKTGKRGKDILDIWRTWFGNEDPTKDSEQPYLDMRDTASQLSEFFKDAPKDAIDLIRSVNEINVENKRNKRYRSLGNVVNCLKRFDKKTHQDMYKLAFEFSCKDKDNSHPDFYGVLGRMKKNIPRTIIDLIEDQVESMPDLISDDQQILTNTIKMLNSIGHAVESMSYKPHEMGMYVELWQDSEEPLPMKIASDQITRAVKKWSNVENELKSAEKDENKKKDRIGLYYLYHVKKIRETAGEEESLVFTDMVKSLSRKYRFGFRRLFTFINLYSKDVCDPKELNEQEQIIYDSMYSEYLRERKKSMLNQKSLARLLRKPRKKVPEYVLKHFAEQFPEIKIRDEMLWLDGDSKNWYSKKVAKKMGKQYAQRFDSRLHDNVIDLIKPDLEDKIAIIDNACGTGEKGIYYVEKLREMGKDVELHQVDIERSMLIIAGSNARRSGVTPYPYNLDLETFNPEDEELNLIDRQIVMLAFNFFLNKTNDVRQKIHNKLYKYLTGVDTIRDERCRNSLLLTEVHEKKDPTIYRSEDAVEMHMDYLRRRMGIRKINLNTFDYGNRRVPTYAAIHNMEKKRMEFYALEVSRKGDVLEGRPIFIGHSDQRSDLDKDILRRSGFSFEHVDIGSNTSVIISKTELE